MIVAEDSDGVCGFLQLLRARDGSTIIDLIAVDERGRGRGLARAMIALVANDRGTGALRVGTQLANRPSLSLYEALGFRMTSAAYVLHLHTGEDR
jgi:ribosomal protein S18 acetylase RimI-like enzyme